MVGVERRAIVAALLAQLDNLPDIEAGADHVGPLRRHRLAARAIAAAAAGDRLAFVDLRPGASY
jgi:hypothetical protein